MKFSVTIPAYKSLYLREAIESVSRQTYTDWELIVVDDCSPEDLRSVVAPYLADGRVYYYRNEKNCGAVDVVHNWNICLSHCTGDYVICMGDDDRLLPCCLEEYSQLIGKYPSLQVFHGRTEVINEEGEVTFLQEPRPEWESVLSLIWNRWAYRNRQYMGDFCYRADYLKRLGGYHQLPLAWGTDDVTAVLAAREQGIANTAAFCFQYRENARSISCSAEHARAKVLATAEQYRWFDTFLGELASESWPLADVLYLKTIERPRAEYFRNSLAHDSIAYMKGNPARLLWCRRQLRMMGYPVSTFIKWYLKSMGL